MHRLCLKLYFHRYAAFPHYVTFWVYFQNLLSSTLSNSQMLQTAASITRLSWVITMHRIYYCLPLSQNSSPPQLNSFEENPCNLCFSLNLFVYPDPRPQPLHQTAPRPGPLPLAGAWRTRGDQIRNTLFHVGPQGKTAGDLGSTLANDSNSIRLFSNKPGEVLILPFFLKLHSFHP